MVAFASPKIWFFRVQKSILGIFGPKKFFDPNHPKKNFSTQNGPLDHPRRELKNGIRMRFAAREHGFWDFWSSKNPKIQKSAQNPFEDPNPVQFTETKQMRPISGRFEHVEAIFGRFLIFSKIFSYLLGSCR